MPRRASSYVAAFAGLGLMLAASPARAQTSASPPPADEPQQADADNPIKAVFFSVRNEYGNQLDDDWAYALILRSDRAWLSRHKRLGGKVGLLTRLDVPIASAHTGGATQTGLGDLYAQALYVPWLTRSFALAMGSGLTFPTATSETIGFGKWQLAPILVPVWFFPRGKGFFLIRLHEHVSFAGDASRPGVNYLQTTPSVIYNFRRAWWLSLDTEATTDWQRDNRISFRSGVELGHIIRKGFGLKGFGLSFKPEIPWGVNRAGDWTVKVILTRYRLPSA